MASIALSGPVNASVFTAEPDSSAIKETSILITGAAQGLGAKLAEACAAAGAYVTVADIRDTEGKQLCSELQSQGYKADFVHCDVTNWKDQVAAFKAAIRSSPSGHLNHVIANAGVMDAPFFTGADEPIKDLDYEPPEPDAAPIEVNLRGAMYTLKLAQLYLTMVSAGVTSPGSRSLMFVLSPQSYLTLPASITYGAAKFGARGLFRSSRIVLASKGVRVNALVPWLMETPMNAGNAGVGQVLNAVGCHFESVEKHVQVAMYLLCSPEIAGRAVAVLQGNGNVHDVEDDEEGRDGAKYRDFGYQGWPTVKQGYVQLYGMLGFQVDPSKAVNY